MAPQLRAAAKDGNGRLFIVPQNTQVWSAAEYVLEKDKSATKNIFLSIPVYAHGGIPYLALLVILCIDHQTFQQNLVLNSVMISCLIPKQGSNPYQKAKFD